MLRVLAHLAVLGPLNVIRATLFTLPPPPSHFDGFPRVSWQSLRSQTFLKNRREENSKKCGIFHLHGSHNLSDSHHATYPFANPGSYGDLHGFLQKRRRFSETLVSSRSRALQAVGGYTSFYPQMTNSEHYGPYSQSERLSEARDSPPQEGGTPATRCKVPLHRSADCFIGGSSLRHLSRWGETEISIQMERRASWYAILETICAVKQGQKERGPSTGALLVVYLSFCPRFTAHIV